MTFQPGQLVHVEGVKGLHTVVADLQNYVLVVAEGSDYTTHAYPKAWVRASEAPKAVSGRFYMSQGRRAVATEEGLLIEVDGTNRLAFFTADWTEAP